MGTRSYLLSGETPPYPDEADEGQAADAQHAIGDPGPAAATATRHRAETRLGRRAGALRARPGGRALADRAPRVPGHLDLRARVGRKENLARVQQTEITLCERSLAADPQRAQ